MPKHPSLPYYVVTVEPITFDADGTSAGGRHGWGAGGWGLVSDDARDEVHDAPPAGASEQMAATIETQLVMALRNAGNVRIIDYAYYWQRRDKPATLARHSAGEVGPLVIRGSVAEFHEIADATASPPGVLARRTGSVVIDVRIIDPTNGRIVATIVARGQATSEDAANGFGLFALGRPTAGFGASALGQANRAAVSSAAQQIVERLSRRR